MDAAASVVTPQVKLFNLERYTFHVKEPKLEKDTSVHARLKRMKQQYEVEGIRRSVDGVLVVHQHNHPHVLLLQIGNTYFKLPGGRLKPGEDEIAGLKRKLTTKLAPNGTNPDWEIGDMLSLWWRPNFETILYPYIPAHITKPKEVKKLFIVPLPDNVTFAVPRNFKLLAVPVFELYDNAQRYGPMISSIAQILSRYQFICINPKDNTQPAPQQQQQRQLQ